MRSVFEDKKFIMKNFLIIPFFLFLLGSDTSLFSEPFYECDEKKYSTEYLVKKSMNGILHIEVRDAEDKGGFGSGVIVGYQNNSTLIITNSHVIDGSSRIEVEFYNGQRLPAIVLLKGEGGTDWEKIQTDLALLKVAGKFGEVLTLNESLPKLGENVFAIGSPEGYLVFSTTKGIVSNIWENIGLIQTDTAINGGNSGGPLLNHSGCVIGINTVGIDPAEVGNDSGLNFAISSKVVKKFIETFNSNKYEITERTPNSDTNENIQKKKNESLYKYF